MIQLTGMQFSVNLIELPTPKDKVWWCETLISKPLQVELETVEYCQLISVVVILFSISIFTCSFVFTFKVGVMMYL